MSNEEHCQEIFNTVFASALVGYQKVQLSVKDITGVFTR